MFTMGAPLRLGDTGTTWNPADKNASITLSNGNRNATGSGVVSVRAIASASSGKRYYEVKVILVTGSPAYVGICDATRNLASYIGGGLKDNSYYSSGQSYHNSIADNTGPPPAFTANDIVGVAVDMTAGKIWFAKNNTWITDGASAGNPSAGTNQRSFVDAATTYYPAVTPGNWVLQANFAAGDFVYAPPTGFAAW